MIITRLYRERWYLVGESEMTVKDETKVTSWISECWWGTINVIFRPLSGWTVSINMMIRINVINKNSQPCRYLSLYCHDESRYMRSVVCSCEKLGWISIEFWEYHAKKIFFILPCLKDYPPIKSSSKLVHNSVLCCSQINRPKKTYRSIRSRITCIHWR